MEDEAICEVRLLPMALLKAPMSPKLAPRYQLIDAVAAAAAAALEEEADALLPPDAFIELRADRLGQLMANAQALVVGGPDRGAGQVEAELLAGDQAEPLGVLLSGVLGHRDRRLIERLAVFVGVGRFVEFGGGGDRVERTALDQIEEIDPEEVVMRITATPLRPHDGAKLAEQILAITRERFDTEEAAHSER